MRLTVIVTSVTGLGCVVGLAVEKMNRGRKMTSTCAQTRNSAFTSPANEHRNRATCIEAPNPPNQGREGSLAGSSASGFASLPAFRSQRVSALWRSDSSGWVTYQLAALTPKLVVAAHMIEGGVDVFELVPVVQHESGVRASPVLPSPSQMAITLPTAEGRRCTNAERTRIVLSSYR
eukprot:scaffold631_cov378-Prasinococcus_capsulatus_cf.AAC.7